MSKFIKIDWESAEASLLKSWLHFIVHVACVFLMGCAGCIIFNTSAKADNVEVWKAIWGNVCSHWVLAASTVIFIVIETYFNIKQDRDACKLTKKNLELRKEVQDCDLLKRNVQSIIKLYLGSVSNALKMSHSERISFYRLSEDSKYFNLVARDSENPKYQFYKKDTFSVDEGIIGLARETGDVCVSNLPSYEDKSGEYISVSQSKFGLSKTRIKELTMKARFYYAYKFSSHNRNEYNSIVVIESMRPQFKDKDEITALFDRDKSFIYELVNKFGKYMPCGDLAKKEAL